jgi:predicted anti-sigma-YlaC factor YlaD
MNCEQLVAYLSDYIDNDLDQELLVAARQHLATCKNCRVVLDTTQKTIFLAHQEVQQVLPPARRKELFARLEQALKDCSDKS